MRLEGLVSVLSPWLFGLFLIAFLRCNLHIIQFICLECMIQWFLLYSWSCAAIIRDIYPKAAPYPLAVTHSPLSTSSPWQSLIHFLSL